MASDSNRYGMESNENYKVLIAQATSKIQVVAYVPETFQVSVTSQFNQPFGQGVQNSPLGTAAKAGGVALTSQSMTAQVWEGTQPIEMSLEFEFIAESSPKEEVMKPILDLLRMTMPSRAHGTPLIEPPGPAYGALVAMDAFDRLQAANNAWSANSGGNFKDAVNAAFSTNHSSSSSKAGREISIKIGNFLIFDNVVIESVNTTFHSMMHESGIPLRATCAVTFKTFFIQLKEDIPNIFIQAGSDYGPGGDRGTRGGA